MISEPLFGSLAFAQELEHLSMAIVRSNSHGYQRILVYGDGDTALCPDSGPYLHYAYSGLPDHVDFFSSFPVLLKAIGYKHLSIKFPPEAYYPWVDRVRSGMRSLQDSIEVQDVNYHLPLNQSFKEILPPDQRRVLRLAQEGGYTCSFSTDWENIQALVSKSRIDKGFTDAISIQLLLKLSDRFPIHYQGLTCSMGDALAGAGVLIKVDESICYLFYVANDPAHLKFSPSLQIINFCSDWAKGQGFKMLDLGTASLNGIVNQGVRNFKESIGGILSIKSTFHIPL